MSATIKDRALDLQTKDAAAKTEALHFDMHGNDSDEERLSNAMKAFARNINRTTATYMESCIHCGICAEACHYYEQTRDPKYTPVWKLEAFKQAYKRESGPFAYVYRLFDLKKPVTVDQLQDWQELVYDSCTMCGRCSLVCPMGIDIATMVGFVRQGMFEAGLAPKDLRAVAERAKVEGSPLGATAEVFKDRIEWMADEHETEVFFDQDKADILVTMSSIEIMKYPNAIGATAKILNALGESWTFRSEGYEATNFGMMTGSVEWQREMTMKLINAAIDCEAKLVLLPECGHAYGALRWLGAAMYACRRHQLGPAQGPQGRPDCHVP